MPNYCLENGNEHFITQETNGITMPVWKISWILIDDLPIKIRICFFPNNLENTVDRVRPIMTCRGKQKLLKYYCKHPLLPATSSLGPNDVTVYKRLMNTEPQGSKWEDNEAMVLSS